MPIRELSRPAFSLRPMCSLTVSGAWYWLTVTYVPCDIVVVREDAFFFCPVVGKTQTYLVTLASSAQQGGDSGLCQCRGQEQRYVVSLSMIGRTPSQLYSDAYAMHGRARVHECRCGMRAYAAGE